MTYGVLLLPLHRTGPYSEPPPIRRLALETLPRKGDVLDINQGGDDADLWEVWWVIHGLVKAPDRRWWRFLGSDYQPYHQQFVLLVIRTALDYMREEADDAQTSG